MRGRGTRLSVTDHGDAELLARARTGEAVAREALLDRHRDAVARVGDPDANAREALAVADDSVPFRVTWLALTATGSVPPDVLAGVRVPWRTAVWHHLVEGEPLPVVAACAGTSEARVVEQLRGAYDDLDPDPSAYRRELAERVLGPHAAAYLAERPEPAPLHRRALRSPAVVAIAAGVVAALVATLYLVPMGGRWDDDWMTATVRLPGTTLVPVAPTDAGPVTRPEVRPGVRPAPPAAGSGPASPPDPGGAPGTPPPTPPPPTPPPPTPPPPPPDPDPGPTVPLPAGTGEVRLGPDQVEVEVRAPGQEPIVVSVPLPVPLPEAPALG